MATNLDNETQTDDEDFGTWLTAADREKSIAELAYLKAERRGFEPGHELDDWLEAEQELMLD